jgi:hypothetical protein
MSASGFRGTGGIPYVQERINGAAPKSDCTHIDLALDEPEQIFYNKGYRPTTAS